MMTDIYEKTTRIFDVVVYINGQLQDISSDSVYIVFKQLKSQTDLEAVILKQASECTVDGVAKFILDVADTTIPPRNYFYEIKWVNNGNTYILESDTVRILERVFD